LAKYRGLREESWKHGFGRHIMDAYLLKERKWTHRGGLARKILASIGRLEEEKRAREAKP